LNLKRRFSVNRRNRTGSVSQLGRRRLLQSHCLLSAQSNQQQQNAGGFSPQILIKSREGICSSQAAQMDPLEDGEAGAGGSTECCAASPFSWLRRLSRELHWSFVLAVVAVYGACQGVGNAVGGVAAGYYWKDVQRVQPSAAQFYQGLTDAPWVIKPLWACSPTSSPWPASAAARTSFSQVKDLNFLGSVALVEPASVSCFYASQICRRDWRVVYARALFLQLIKGWGNIISEEFGL
jgi:hypothetical protein